MSSTTPSRNCFTSCKEVRMFALKPISHDSVSGALAKAERYRLLNEPGEAESICRDILDIEPDNQQALISLILALTDQIPDHPGVFQTALASIGRFQSAYDRAYYRSEEHTSKLQSLMLLL